MHGQEGKEMVQCGKMARTKKMERQRERLTAGWYLSAPTEAFLSEVGALQGVIDKGQHWWDRQAEMQAFS